MNSFIRYALRQFNVTRQYPNGYVETVVVWAEIEHEARLLGSMPLNGTGHICEVLSCQRVGTGVVAKIHGERIAALEIPTFICTPPTAA